MDRFLNLLAGYMDEYQPSTASQATLVETMAVARWRQLRIWGAQKTEMDRDMANRDPSVGPLPSVLSRPCAVRPNASAHLNFCFAMRSPSIANSPEPWGGFWRFSPFPPPGSPPNHPESHARQTWKEENIPLRDEPQEPLKTND